MRESIMYNSHAAVFSKLKKGDANETQPALEAPEKDPCFEGADKAASDRESNMWPLLHPLTFNIRNP
jgi:hypothetical protein